MGTIRSAYIRGTEAVPVTLEVHPCPGQGFGVELAAASEKETRVRIRAACAALGLALPEVRVRVLDARGEPVAPPGAASLDLPIALAALTHGEDVPDRYAFGELSLAGEVRHGRGLYGFVELAFARGHVPIIPAGVRAPGAGVQGVRTLGEAVRAVAERPASREGYTDGDPLYVPPYSGPDLADATIPPEIRRALEIAAVGGHGLLLVGPPGAGKTMAARRLPGILPEPTAEETAELRRIASAAGLASPAGRPFRAPHHTASSAAMVGGGQGAIRPGEVTLAHGGVLFLDEIGEFPRPVVEALRGALLERRARVVRGRESVTMPARPCVTVAAMNPCPCGYAGDRKRVCSCTPARVAAYLARLEPLRNVLPIRVRMPAISRDAIRAGTESSATVRERVTRAQNRLREGAVDDDKLSGLVARYASGTLATVRSIARTIAALEGAEAVEQGHVVEAQAWVGAE